MTGATKRRIAVLMGGPSSERDVSLVSGASCVSALRDLGHDIIEIDVSHDMDRVVRELVAAKPDIAFNALHGRFGEDGCIQGVLELMQIPYTHSGVLASALAMDKPAARRLFADAGLTCAEGRVYARDEVVGAHVMAPPYVIKPLNEGSSVGVDIILEGDPPPVAKNWNFGANVLVERYIPGREIQVAIMGARALGAIEIRPQGRFYDYEAKYTDGKAEHLMPAPIHTQAYDAALDIAARAHVALGCRGVSRADLRYDDTAGEPGALYLLEINTQPGMTPLSLVPEIAAHAGIGFNELVSWMVEDASCPR